MKVVKIIKVSLLFTLVIALTMFSLAQININRLQNQEMEKIKTELDEIKKQNEKYSQMSPLDKALSKYFSEDDAKIAKAILTHESRLNQKAINHNCIYEGRSTFCKKGDESLAWSVDCGIAQLNYHQKVCPSWTFEIEPSIKKMASMYKQRGWSPWVSYKTKAYLAFM